MFKEENISITTIINEATLFFIKTTPFSYKKFLLSKDITSNICANLINDYIGIFASIIHYFTLNMVVIGLNWLLLA